MEAKAYLQQKFPHSKMVFIVASDDRNWCQKMFSKEENMIMTKWDSSPGLDLAILSHCNHSIIRFVYLLLCMDSIYAYLFLLLLCCLSYQTSIHVLFSKCFQFYFSSGTFSFWSAYLKPKMGEVVVADGYSLQISKIAYLSFIKSALPEWKIISDPCFSKPNNSQVHSAVPELTPECLGKEKEYGIN